MAFYSPSLKKFEPLPHPVQISDWRGGLLIRSTNWLGDALMTLPGVGRKTANVVMSVGFNAPAIAVDTHVFRVSNRLKLAAGDTLLAVEQGLMKAIPKDKWSAAHHWLIWHGRNICKARKRLCGKCPLADVCPTAIDFQPSP
jgi:endonuclease-3